MSRISKADEATTWRRQAPINDHHSKPQGSHSSFHRPASAGPSSYGRSSHSQAAAIGMPIIQQPAPQMQRAPVPSTFNVVEAQALLEQRWVAVCQGGLAPTCQCSQQQEQQSEATTTADGDTEQEGNFLQALRAATTKTSADSAWDDG